MAYFPQASKGGGKCVGFPDVCKVPAPPAPAPVPTPFPNMVQMADAKYTVAKVQILNKDIVVESSEVPPSTGDELGSLKGMVKATKLANESTFKVGSSKVFATGMKAVVHLAPTAHNGSNLPAGGVHCIPSQTKVLTHV
jgi:hypothetical protein